MAGLKLTKHTANPTTAFEHGHGLGADPATGHTYAATHQGVWLIPTGDLPGSCLAGAPRPDVGELAPIGGRAQDTMGFTVARLYVDHGESRNKASLTQFAACLDYLRAGDLLLVCQLDRLGRDDRLIGLINELGERGIGLRSLAEPAIDTTTSTGQAH